LVNSTGLPCRNRIISRVLSEAAGIVFGTLGVKAAGGLVVLGAAPGPRADPFGIEATGNEATGIEATGIEATGNEATGNEATGNEATGCGASGSAWAWNWACWIWP
jgi:hypothetical protein